MYVIMSNKKIKSLMYVMIVNIHDERLFIERDQFFKRVSKLND